MIHRQGIWLATVLIVITAAGTLALAQPTIDPSASGSTNDLTFLTPEQRAKLRDRFQHRRGRMELRHRGLELVDSVYDTAVDPARAAIVQIQRIEKIYRVQGDMDGLRAFYQDLLNRTDNLVIRNVVYLKLGEINAHGRDPGEALALLQQGLEENLRQLE